MNNKLLPKFIIAVALFLFFSLGGIIIAQTYFTANKCVLGDTNTCYREITDTTNGVKKVMIENLDPNKSYEFVVKDQNGKVVESGQVTKEEFQDFIKKNENPGVTCSDTDGHNYYERGALSLSSGFQISDQCNGNKVLENYCDDNEQKREFHQCEYGCANGACLDSSESLCTDSDEGQDFYEKGVIVKADVEYIDSCGEYERLTEYWCDNDGNIKNAEFECFGGCSDGACGYSEYGNGCRSLDDCEIGYECKATARYPGTSDDSFGDFGLRNCCLTSECASEIPEGPGSDDAQPYCVSEGGTDQTHNALGGKAECHSGEWCYPKDVFVVDKNTECCAGLEIKPNLFIEDMGGQEMYGCCSSNDCAAINECWSNGSEVGEWGKKCDNGTWVDFVDPSVKCYEADNGENYYSKSKLYWTTQSFIGEDYCIDNKSVHEFYCNGDAYLEKDYNCHPSACIDGACALTF